MSQISDVSSPEEMSSYVVESDHSTSSHSRCSSSNSTITNAVQTERKREASTSLETGWTDSKHSSYLDFMEANFVRNMYGSRYCAEDVCGKSPCNHHQSVDIEEEYDDDSAQSELHIPYETIEFRMCDHGEWTSRPASRLMAPAGMPLFLLTNPWVRHFRPKNASPIPSTRVLLRKGQFRGMASSSPKPATGRAEHIQRVNTLELAPSTNHVDAAVSNTKKRALWTTNHQVPVTRQKIDNEVKSGVIGSNNEVQKISHEGAFAPNSIPRGSA